LTLARRVSSISPQRAVPLEGWEEEQGARAAPEDLWPLSGFGRESALLGRVRTCQGAC